MEIYCYNAADIYNTSPFCFMSKESPYHHVRQKNGEHGGMVIKVRVTNAVHKILTKDSPEVKESGGFFIYQENGQYSLMFKKNFFIHPDYIKLLGIYMVVNGNCITLEAKRAFESENEEVIRELIRRARTLSNRKKHGGG